MRRTVFIYGVRAEESGLRVDSEEQRRCIVSYGLWPGVMGYGSWVMGHGFVSQGDQVDSELSCCTMCDV